MRIVSFAAIALLTGSLVCQGRELVVDASGKQGDFREIVDAVADAKPGDRILVHGGSYAGFTLDKGVVILGLAPCFIVERANTPARIRIENVAARDTAFVSGMFLESDDASLEIVNCLGPVHFGACYTKTSNTTNVLVRDSASVVLRELVVRNGTWAIEGSRVAISESALNTSNSSSTPRGTGLVFRIKNSVVELSQTKVAAFRGSEEPAIDMENTELRAFGWPTYIISEDCFTRTAIRGTGTYTSNRDQVQLRSCGRPAALVDRRIRTQDHKPIFMIGHRYPEGPGGSAIYNLYGVRSTPWALFLGRPTMPITYRGFLGRWWLAGPLFVSSGRISTQNIVRFQIPNSKALRGLHYGAQVIGYDGSNWSFSNVSTTIVR